MIPPKKVVSELGPAPIEIGTVKGLRIDTELKSKNVKEVPQIETLAQRVDPVQDSKRIIGKGTDLDKKSSLKLLGVKSDHLPPLKKRLHSPAFNVFKSVKRCWSKSSTEQKRSHSTDSDGEHFWSKVNDPPSHESYESDKKNIADSVKKRKNPSPKYKLDPKFHRSSFQMKNDSFRNDIVHVVKRSQVKEEVDKKKRNLTEREENFKIYKRVNLLRYRADIFKAAGKISMNISPFPIWAYKDQSRDKLDIVKINVGGKKFEVFADTIMNIPHSKLSNCYVNHSGDQTIFFDRDAGCFNHIINFFRSGRLHAPTNDCLSFFEEELLFWGVNEDLMEPCCYSEYMAYKNTCDTLKRYADAKHHTDHDVKDGHAEAQTLRQKIYLICSSPDFGVLGKWYAIICGTAIILSITTMVIAANAQGRIDKITGTFSEKGLNESIVDFFGRTSVNPSVNSLDLMLVLFFLTDFIARCTLTPDRLLFFSDTINWIDFIATLSSLLSYLARKKDQTGEFEPFVLFMKSPRIFRIFRLTKNMKLGFDALVLTLRARSSALKMVFTLVIITMSIFGTLIYVVEMINEKKGYNSQFRSIFDGMWFAIVTMSTVGYGDLTPKSASGYLIGFFCIITGIIISQLPVPVVLKNFANYYEQMHSRQREMNKVLNKNIDPENVMEERLTRKKAEEERMKEEYIKTVNDLKT